MDAWNHTVKYLLRNRAVVTFLPAVGSWQLGTQITTDPNPRVSFGDRVRVDQNKQTSSAYRNETQEWEQPTAPRNVSISSAIRNQIGLPDHPSRITGLVKKAHQKDSNQNGYLPTNREACLCNRNPSFCWPKRGVSNLGIGNMSVVCVCVCD